MWRRDNTRHDPAVCGMALGSCKLLFENILQIIRHSPSATGTVVETLSRQRRNTMLVLFNISDRARRVGILALLTFAALC